MHLEIATLWGPDSAMLGSKSQLSFRLTPGCLVLLPHPEVPANPVEVMGWSAGRGGGL